MEIPIQTNRTQLLKTVDINKTKLNKTINIFYGLYPVVYWYGHTSAGFMGSAIHVKVTCQGRSLARFLRFYAVTETDGYGIGMWKKCYFVLLTKFSLLLWLYRKFPWQQWRKLRLMVTYFRFSGYTQHRINNISNVRLIQIGALHMSHGVCFYSYPVAKWRNNHAIIRSKRMGLLWVLK